MSTVENRLAVCTEYTKLWKDYFAFYADGFDEKQVIGDQDEMRFFQLMNILAMNHYRFSEMAAEHFKDSAGILQVLADTVSLNAIRQMSEAQFSKLLIDWHTLFIAMNKAIGKLKTQLPAPKEGK
jgi:hypothetical protein